MAQLPNSLVPSLRRMKTRRSLSSRWSSDVLGLEGKGVGRDGLVSVVPAVRLSVSLAFRATIALTLHLYLLQLTCACLRAYLHLSVKGSLLSR